MNPDSIREAIREKYAAVARSPEGKFRYPTGREGAEALGYPGDCLDTAPAKILEGFCGVGHPLGIGTVGGGEAVLDVGCGSGLDLWCARCRVGTKGRLCGIDASPEMAERAQRAFSAAEEDKVEILSAQAENIPHPDRTFDMVLSNGALNLSPEKDRAFCEIHRVLRPGGRFWFADMVLREELPPEERTAKAWSE